MAFVSSFILSIISLLIFYPQLGTAYPSAGLGKDGKPITLDVPYAATPAEVVNRMLQMAQIKKDEKLYDLGSGDGRILIQAVKNHNARGVGIDLDPFRIEMAKSKLQREKLEGQVELIEANVLTYDFSDADVITMYLLPEVNLKLRPRLKSLKPGTRIVSHNFDMGDWKPHKYESIIVDGRRHEIFLWIVGKESTH